MPPDPLVWSAFHAVYARTFFPDRAACRFHGKLTKTKAIILGKVGQIFAF